MIMSFICKLTLGFHLFKSTSKDATLPNSTVYSRCAPLSIRTPFKLNSLNHPHLGDLKCRAIMCLRIAFVKACVVIDCFFRCYASIDQAAGVTPQYPDDPYYQHSEQGKRNPPSEHVLSYFPQIFSPL